MKMGIPFIQMNDLSHVWSPLPEQMLFKWATYETDPGVSWLIFLFHPTALLPWVRRKNFPPLYQTVLMSLNYVWFQNKKYLSVGADLKYRFSCAKEFLVTGYAITASRRGILPLLCIAQNILGLWTFFLYRDKKFRYNRFQNIVIFRGIR